MLNAAVDRPLPPMKNTFGKKIHDEMNPINSTSCVCEGDIDREWEKKRRNERIMIMTTTINDSGNNQSNLSLWKQLRHSCDVII